MDALSFDGISCLKSLLAFLDDVIEGRIDGDPQKVIEAEFERLRVGRAIRWLEVESLDLAERFSDCLAIAINPLRHRRGMAVELREVATWITDVVARIERHAPPANPEAECVYLGAARFRIGAGPPFVVGENDAVAIETLIKWGAATGPQLQHDGISNPSSTFKRIKDRYSPLCPFISLPGGKKNGLGFRTTIRRESK